MEIPSTTFEDWEALHRDELIDEYRAYLRHALDDDDFAVRAVWDYEAWARGEYDTLHDYAETVGEGRE